MPATHRDLARRWFDDVWNKKRDTTVHQLLGKDAVCHMEGGDFVGPDRFLDARAALLQAFPDIGVVIEDVVEDGDRAVVRWSAVGHHKGELLGIRPSGSKIRFRGITWMVFKDGKVVEGWDSWNMGGLLNDCRAANA